MIDLRDPENVKALWRNYLYTLEDRRQWAVAFAEVQSERDALRRQISALTPSVPSPMSGGQS